MKSFISILAIPFLAFPLLASGQIDPGPDGLGLYFDEDATQVSAVVLEGTESISAFLVLTNPTAEGNLNHWSAGVSAIQGAPGNAMVAGSPVVGHNLALNMPGSEHWVFEVAVGEDPPLPAAEVVVLAEIVIWPFVYDAPIPLFVTYGWEFGGYGTGEGGASFNPSSGSWDLPVAVINGQAPVSVGSRTWDQIKATYR